MSTKRILLSFALVAGAMYSYAQYIPSHDKYVEDMYMVNAQDPIDKEKMRNARFYEYFRDWEPGKELTEDDNFYISRVKIKDRFVNTATQVDPEMTQDRKFCLWTPMGISDTYWQTLPRYVLDGDNFGMWSYLDYQGGWSLPWVRVPGSFSDVAHKNGVTNGCLIFFDSWGGDNTEASNIVNMLVEKDGSNFKYLDKFIRFLKYYGVDGVGVNPEGTIPNHRLLMDFFAECFKRAPQLNWHFHVYWYAANTNNGNQNVNGSHVLDNSFKDWFRNSNKEKVTDMYMLNYGWGGTLDTSISTANSFGDSKASYDVFVGYDIQGNWLGRGPWSEVATRPLSIAFWGNHTTDMIYQNATENGSGDEAVQYCYLTKQEQVFSGGYRNPAFTPDIKNYLTNSSEEAMKQFHGIAKLMPARSTLQELPFVTYFNLGNGKTFRNEGEVTFDQKWYNIGVQDYLPTWRWWITDASGKALSYYDEKVIDCSFTFDDAWYGGSSMVFSGETETSAVRLFKTKFNVTANSKVSLVYKMVDGTTNPHMKLFWSFVGSETEFHEKEIPVVEELGEWKKVSFLASQIGMSGDKEVAMIGLRFDNTEANYKVLVGEFSIVPSTKFNPVMPQITKAEILKRTFNSLDFKLIWKSKDQDPSKLEAGEPVYNNEVDTWFFEVYSQAEGGEPQLCGTTTSWAHYVVNASANSNIEKYRIGVCAVAPDGKTKSEIAWTDYMESEKTLVTGIEIDKPVIKINEEFTLKYKDPFYPNAEYWEVFDAATGESAGDFGYDSHSHTMTLDKVGYYDVKVTNGDGSEDFYRGFIQISPEETGALPLIKSFNADKTKIEKGGTVALTYEAERLGEGTVSRGLEITDPNIFMVNKEVLPAAQCGKAFSVAVWVKPSKFAHSKYGINLINKRNTQRGWPHNNWGQFWVHIWPEVKNVGGQVILSENIVSFTMYYPNGEQTPWFNNNTNKHEIPNIGCCTDGYVRINSEWKKNNPAYSLAKDLWSHIIISFDGKTQRIFFNGKQIGNGYDWPFEQYDESPIYFGGSNVYHTGFTGTIDEVQVWHKAITTNEEALEAMAGYKEGEVPAELKGYYTFEDYNPETFAFKNIGSLGSSETYDGYYIMQKGTGGENTQGAADVHVAANNSVTGNPALPGTLDIKTKATFTAGGYPIITPTEGGATATFPNDGTFDVTLTLSNDYGKATMTKTEYIVVGTGVGINDEVVEDLGVYPNPFVDAVNVVFATGGNYTVNVFTVDGALCYSQNVIAMENEVKRIGVDGKAGMYLLQIMKDGKVVKTVKVNKQ